MVIDQLILFYKPNKKMSSGNMIDSLLLEPNTLFNLFYKFIRINLFLVLLLIISL
jgi:hypothetical protein